MTEININEEIILNEKGEIIDDYGCPIKNNLIDWVVIVTIILGIILLWVLN